VINNSISGAGENTELFIDSSSLGQNPIINISGGAQIELLDSSVYIKAPYSSVHYTATAETIDGNFRGIDAKLGTLQPSGSYITALSGDVSGTGPGSVSATVNSVGGQTAANVAAATLLANAATNSDTASAIVKRDGSGSFSMGTLSCVGITASLGAAGSSAFAVTGTNPNVNIGSYFNVAQVTAGGSYFTGTANGDCILRQNNTAASIYLGVGSSVPDFQIADSYVRSISTFLVSGNTTYASAAFVVNSTTQGSIFSPMTTAQKNSISSPADGLTVWDTTLHKLCVYSTGTSSWQTVTSV
jgi:hypothetical protein